MENRVSNVVLLQENTPDDHRVDQCGDFLDVHLSNLTAVLEAAGWTRVEIGTALLKASVRYLRGALGVH